MPLQGLPEPLSAPAAATKAGGLALEGGADGEQPANDGYAFRAALAPLPVRAAAPAPLLTSKCRPARPQVHYQGGPLPRRGRGAPERGSGPSRRRAAAGQCSGRAAADRQGWRATARRRRRRCPDASGRHAPNPRPARLPLAGAVWPDQRGVPQQVSARVGLPAAACQSGKAARPAVTPHAWPQAHALVAAVPAVTPSLRSLLPLHC